MTVSESRSASAAERLLLWAVALSLLIHLAAFACWKLGQTRGWWKHLTLPAWIEMGQKNLASTIAKKLPVVPKPQQTPLLFVDVDPALASETPPEKPKFYSPANSIAANPVKTVPSDMPQINGLQDKVPKTISQGAKSVPLQPSPPQPETKDTVEAKPLAKPTYTPGDLTLAKPADKAREGKGTAEADPSITTPTEKPHQRPRTIADALAAQGTPDPPSRQSGGTARLSPDPSMDAIRTSYGDYDRDLIEAIRSRWYTLLEHRTTGLPGKVVLDFDLHADGRISDMKMTGNEVTDLLGFLCEEAVLDPAPYAKWPQKMREEVPNPRHLTFTFFYENY